MPFRDMAEKYYDFNDLSEGKEVFVSTIEKFMNRYDYTCTSKEDIEQDVDIIVSKKILVHLEEFFNREQKNKNSKTRKHRRRRKRSGVTMKNSKVSLKTGLK